MNLLDCCEEISEAKTILMNQYDNDKDKVEYYTKYPRIETAMRTGQERFVGHDFCQQILREDWLKSQTTGNIIQWQVSNIWDILLYCLSSVFFFPIHLLGCIVLHCRNRCSGVSKNSPDQQSHSFMRAVREAFSFLTYPINRYITNCCIFILYIILLIWIANVFQENVANVAQNMTEESLNEDVGETKADSFNINMKFTPIEILTVYLFLTSLGFLFPELKMLYRGFSFWPCIFNCIGLTAVIIALAMRYVRSTFHMG